MEKTHDNRSLKIILITLFVTAVVTIAGGVLCCLISFICPVAVMAPLVGTAMLQPVSMSESEAITAVQAVYPEFLNYPSNDLPPTYVNSVSMFGQWHLAFVIEGSGVPYIVKATCFSVSADGSVRKTGEYWGDYDDPRYSISALTCE